MPRAIARRHIGGVHDVLDAERHAVERPACRALIARARLLQALDRDRGNAHAPTTGSRAAMRSRQARVSVSEVSFPAAMRRAASRADRWVRSVMWASPEMIGHHSSNHGGRRRLPTMLGPPARAASIVARAFMG